MKPQRNSRRPRFTLGPHVTNRAGPALRRRAATVLLGAFALSFLLVAAQATPAHAQGRGRGGVHVSVVGRGFPIRRPPVPVIVRSRPFAFRIEPTLFLPPVVWTDVVVAAPPAPASILWRDEQPVLPADGWTEVTLDCNRDGSMLQLDVEDGAVNADWAEVVYGDGESQVVDFDGARLTPGLHTLLRLDPARHVDHVRMVLRAPRAAARVTLELTR